MTGLIIQARMNSTRLPGKVLMPIGKKLLLEHILHRLKYKGVKAKIIVATTVKSIDDAVFAFCNAQGVGCFRGDELNVLERYYFCAKEYGFTNIVRMTGDNPFPDIDELQRLVALHKSNHNHYTECLTVLPIGVGMEIFTFCTLKRSYEEASKPHHFEHVNEYILENMALFRHETLRIPTDKNMPKVRLTVDIPDDYELACYVSRNADSEYVTTQEAIKLYALYNRKEVRGGKN